MKILNFMGKNILVTSYFLFNNDLSYIPQTIINGSNPSQPDSASCVLIISGEDSTAILQGFTITGGTGTSWPDEHSPGTFVEGGGIIVALSSPTIRYNIITDNKAIRRTSGITSAGGGGIRCGDGNPKIFNNIVMNNSGMYGGGIVMNFCSGEIKNNLIINNIVSQAVTGAPTYGGGGLWINGGITTTIVENNVIMGNSSSGSGSQAAGKGGGILIWTIKVNARNNIIWGNSQAAGNQVQTLGATVVFEYNDIEGGFSGTGNINVNPIIDTINFMLAQLSPCIDTGNPDSLYNDPEDSSNPGLAKFPSLGTVRNDMGIYGGPERNLLPEIPTGINNDEGELLPEYFKLFQNFPNPFNPVTRIRYSISQYSFVSIKIYDVLGNELSNLINMEQSPGQYEIEFDGKNFSSGIYFYKINVNEFQKTLSMVLMK